MEPISYLVERRPTLERIIEKLIAVFLQIFWILSNSKDCFLELSKERGANSASVNENCFLEPFANYRSP